ncbi:hypothetical protein KW803_03200 [Candidatus Saccharibacteria bacterium]|nr:hypothetical protein [Candidatus Saccharibacteria bacterium]
MNKSLNTKSLNSLKPILSKFSKRFGKHIIFAALFGVLLVYLLIVFRISNLAKAEPSPEQEINVTSSIPKVDKNAVTQIQKLEQNNTEIHALFETARNNPFQE